MTRLVACVVAVFIVTGVAVAGRQQAPAPAARTAAAPDAAFVKQYCLGCHNSRTNAGGLALDALNALNVDGHAEVWEKVVRKLRTGAMPPDGAPRPAPARRHRQHDQAQPDHRHSQEFESKCVHGNISPICR